MAAKASGEGNQIELNVGVVSCCRSGDVATALVEEKNTLESREDLARGKATQAAILTKPRRRKLQAMATKASGDGGEKILLQEKIRSDQVFVLGFVFGFVHGFLGLGRTRKFVSNS